MDQQKAINDLIRRIYKTALDPVEWDDLLGLLADSFSSPIIASLDQSVKSGQAQRSRYVGLEQQALQDYEEYYGPRSVLFRDIADNYSSGSVFLDEMSSNYQEYLASETYHDYHRKYQAERGLSLLVSNTKNQANYIVLRRPEKKGYYRKEEVELANLLMPHLVQANYMARELGQKDLLTHAFEDAFNKLSAGIVIINKPNHVIFSNQAAEQLFSRGDGLTMLGKKLHANQQQANSELQAGIHQLFEWVDGGSVHSSKPLLIARTIAARPYQVSLMPLIQDVLSSHSSHELGLVMIHDPDALALNSEQLLVSLYQLTMAEARVVEALCNGLSVAEIAATLNNTENAVRFHIKNVFQKLHVKRQSELVSLILKGPMSQLSQKR